ncbi:dynamin family protein [Paenibacillus sp. CC-CFT747]|nr:dynamin family protein [Paenibacillus sp. CC-CFT747]
MLTAEPPQAAASRTTSLLTDRHHRGRLESSAGRLKEAAHLLQEIPAMKSQVRSMLDKAERLEKNRFTIALFGAFSAGKSSFANALLGERILPVSPNPTTAAINMILPVDQEHPHGTVVVRMKSPAYMLDEVQHSLKVLGVEGGGWEDSLRSIRGLTPDRVTEAGKPHYSFLQAVNKGWEQAKEHLGQEKTVGLNEFAEYVADESKSCFVETIGLHYSNPLTDQGIVFVDTPGADSINARHTGVAFNYIKNADAILFVTYYNHAFSQADREFLLQLGRVKDAFELDKMFFLVNASDLAADEEELGQVIRHVEDNLVKHGVRNPRMYPVSSQLAVQAKQSGDGRMLQQSGITVFEEDFIRFTLGELTDMAERSARQELTRASAQLSEWIGRSQESEEQRQAQLRDLNAAYSEALTIIQDREAPYWRQELTKEIEELLYYVKQRLSFRFGELYSMAFNPSSLQDDGRDIKQALRSSWFELVRLVSYDLSQEVLATTLRIESYLNKSLAKQFASDEAVLHSRMGTYPGMDYPVPAFRTPQVREQIEAGEADIKRLAGYFRNAKAFFEGEGKQKLRSVLETDFNGWIQLFVDKHREEFETEYAAQYVETRQNQRSLLTESAAEHYEGMKSALEMKVDLNGLQQKQNQIGKMLE